MKAGKSYIKVKGDFLEKLTNLGNIPFNVILVTANVVGLYPSIPHDAGLQALYERLEERADKKNSIYWLGWDGWIYIKKQFRWIWN